MENVYTAFGAGICGGLVGAFGAWILLVVWVNKLRAQILTELPGLSWNFVLPRIADAMPGILEKGAMFMNVLTTTIEVISSRLPQKKVIDMRHHTAATGLRSSPVPSEAHSDEA